MKGSEIPQLSTSGEKVAAKKIHIGSNLDYKATAVSHGRDFALIPCISRHLIPDLIHLLSEEISFLGEVAIFLFSFFSLKNSLSQEYESSDELLAKLVLSQPQTHRHEDHNYDSTSQCCGTASATRIHFDS